MIVQFLQHVPFEGPGVIATWAAERGYESVHTPVYETRDLPDPDEVDLLVIMGGPMSVHDEARHPWLVPEKRFIERCVSNGMKTVGICLGAQLLADVLGAEVHTGSAKEIGWLPVEWSSGALGHPLFRGLPSSQTVFHWHGDMFEIPEGAVHLASSAGCPNQAFLYENRALGIQFHLELTPGDVRELAEQCESEIDEQEEFIQSKQHMLEETRYFKESNRTICTLLDRLTGADR